ncbi:MAG: glutamate--tRNA ligase [bacterium]|nr:glutamate--tRNA ligase [bacterium]
MLSFLKNIFGGKNKVIVRFAPSPTGELHIGGARTAFFNYLFARRNGGKFLLRIEDTDRERLVPGSVDRIKAALKWLGMELDNEGHVMVQSERVDIYKKRALELLEKKDAYVCVCSKEKLAADQEEQMKMGRPPMYSGHCREVGIKISEVEGKEPYVIRMKMPKIGKITVHDLIRGDVEFDQSLIDDQVLLKSDGYPTYHLANVIDDREMKISHVIRAEEWLPSTPKHLVLYKMFGWEAPKFAHLPMILAPDKSKLSKRHGATGVFEYKQLGYLPEAILNFIGLMGWHPKEDREVLSFKEMIKEFSLDRVQKGGAIFDVKKLNWLNSEYIKKAPVSELKKSLADIFGHDFIKKDLIDKLINLSRDRMEKLTDFKEMNEFFFNLPNYEKQLLVWKNSPLEKSFENLKLVLEKISEINENDFNKAKLESILMPFANEIGRGDVLWPLRVSLSGKDKSPGPFDIMGVLGKKETIRRINIALEK